MATAARTDPLIRRRIAVLGAGLVGRRHAALVSREAGCELAAVVDPDPRTEAVARELGVPWLPGLDRLLETSPPDGVVVATPNALHVEHSLACIAAGAAVLVEKPVAESVEEALRIAAAAEAAGVPVLVGHHRRHSPLLVRAREVVTSGELGEVVAVSGSAVFAKPAEYFAAASWRSRPGGGPVLINMVHEVDDLRFLCGEIEQVTATASHRVRGSAVEDTAAMTLRFASGALGTFLLSDAAVSPHSWEQTSGEDPAYAHYPDEDCYLIAGTRGSLSVPTMRLRRHEGPPSWWRPTLDSVVPVVRADPLAAQLRHFRDVLDSRAEPLVGVRDAAESVRVVGAIARSAGSGVPVTCAPTVPLPAPEKGLA